MDLLQEGGVSEGCLWDCQAWGAWSSAGQRGLEAVASGHLARGSVQESSSPLIGSPSTRSWEKSPLITVAVNVTGPRCWEAQGTIWSPGEQSKRALCDSSSSRRCPS